MLNIEKKVDTRTFSNFEIFGSYFVNFYFNVVYSTIKKSLELLNTDASMRDAFSEFVQNYEQSIKLNRTFTTLIKELHDYYQKMTKYCTLVEFEKEILGTFMPKNEVEILTTNERMSWIAKIVSLFINKFSLAILSTYLNVIVEERNRTAENARILQNEVNHIFYLIREDIQSTLAKNKYQKDDRISVEVVNKMREEYNNLKKKIDTMNEKNANFSNTVEKLKELHVTEKRALEQKYAAALEAEKKKCAAAFNDEKLKLQKRIGELESKVKTMQGQIDTVSAKNAANKEPVKVAKQKPAAAPAPKNNILAEDGDSGDSGDSGGSGGSGDDEIIEAENEEEEEAQLKKLQAERFKSRKQ